MKLKNIGHFTTYGGLPKEIYLLFCSRVITCVGSFIMPLLTLILTQKLGMSKTETGNFSALLILSQAPCLLIGGKLIDVIGKKKVLVACQALGSIAYLICGFTQSHTMLVFIVMGANLFVAASPAYQAMVAQLTTPGNRKASFSLLYLGINLGMAISPLIGGLLFKDYLQLLFILDGVTSLISTFLIVLFVKEPENDQQNETYEAGNKNLVKNASVFSVLKTVPVLSLFILFIFSYNFTYTQWNFLLPLQFGDLYVENGARFFSMLTVVNPLIVITCTPILTKLTTKFHSLAVISGGGILFFGAFALFAFVKSMPLFMLAGAIFTFGEIVVTINTGAFIADHSPAAHLGRITAVSMFMQGTANALGPLIMGHVISATNYFISWLLTAFFILAGAVGMYLLNKKESKANIQP